MMQNTEAAIWDVLYKKMFLKILQNPQENTSASVFILIKLQAEACNFTKKRDSGWGVFLWILQNF